MDKVNNSLLSFFWIWRNGFMQWYQFFFMGDNELGIHLYSWYSECWTLHFSKSTTLIFFKDIKKHEIYNSTKHKAWYAMTYVNKHYLFSYINKFYLFILLGEGTCWPTFCHYKSLQDFSVHLLIADVNSQKAFLNCSINCKRYFNLLMLSPSK